MTENSPSPVARVRDLSPESLNEIVMGAPVTFVTGKGGVGKTTIATLLTKEAISHGERVLFISLYRDAKTDELVGVTDADVSHDIFHSPLLGSDVSIITPASALSNYLAAKHMGSITKRLNKSGLLDMVANIVPGMRELLVIGDIRSKAQSGQWDRVIVDAPSTGHARSLFNISEQTGGVARSGVIKHQGDAAREFLRDHTMVQVIVATLDHAMPLSECREFIFELEDTLRMNIAGVVINKSHVVSSGKSYGINKNFSDIFIPLYALEPRDIHAKKRRTIRSLFRLHEKTPDDLNSHIEVKSTTTSAVVLGTGGVGKTTVAAAIALGSARSHKKIALLTIDPARRLGTALGLENTASRESFLDADSMKHVDARDANFHVFQLDTTHEFMELLRKTLSEAEFKNCEDNTFVAAISKMGIVNEFMAIEAMHRLVNSGTYDIVVIDTPPSHHVFDLLEAPQALKRMTESNVYRTLVGAGTMASITTSMALNTIFRPLRGLVGTELVSDAVEFMRMLKDVEEVFAAHSQEVVESLASTSTQFIGVCNPTDASLEQISGLIEGMDEREFHHCSVVINGVNTHGEDDLDELAFFARGLQRFDAPVTILEEQELDDPFEIVSAISQKVALSS